MRPDSYFLAVTFPFELAERAQKYRDLAASYSRFKTPLHITIIPPFTINSKEENLINLLENGIEGLRSGKITLDSISYFEIRKCVAYLKPNSESEIYLKKLFSSVSIVIEKAVKQGFHKGLKPEDIYPHLTIAKKIPRNELDNIKKIFEKFNDVFVFIPRGIDLYKQPNSFGPWVKIKEIPISESGVNQPE